MNVALARGQRRTTGGAVRRTLGRALLAATLLGVLGVGLVSPGLAQTVQQPATPLAPDLTAPFEDGTVLVGYHVGVSDAAADEIERQVGARRERVIGAGTHVLRVGSGRVPAAIAALAQQRGVRYGEPNYEVRIATAPNDTRYGELWGLHNTGQRVNGTTGTAGADVDAQLAWDVATGSPAVVVGVVDTGIDYGHPDLTANVWSNPGGVWGCAAGTHGYNAFTGSCDPMDDHDHGTHVAGILGATGNNASGVVGVSWRTSLMGLKMLDAAGNGNTTTFLAVIDRAIEAKQAGVNLRVLNASIGNAAYSQAVLDDLNRLEQNGILFVTAAANGVLFGTNNDTTPNYPCNYAVSTLICVTATTQTDGRAGFANYGATSVDLGAPGVNILSTVRNGGYTFKQGTSQATPFVAGTAALILGAFPELTVQQVRSAVLGSTDSVSALSGRTATGGRLNTYRAVTAAGAMVSGTATPQPSATATPQPSATPTHTPTATPTAVASPTATAAAPGGTTGWRGPSANAALAGGDGNGFERAPGNAHASDGRFAEDRNSGTSTSTDCAGAGKDGHTFSGYALLVPAGATVRGIEVQLEARADSTAGAPSMCVQLSWDGGATWSAVKAAQLARSEATYVLGGAADTWSHVWGAADLDDANWRVRVVNVAGTTNRDFYLDWVGVRVTYQ